MRAGWVLTTVACLAACDSAPHLTTVTEQLCTSTGDGGGGCCPGSPIIIDTAGDGIHLTAAEDGVLFQLHPGRFGLWAWTAPGSDDAFLALDVNGDGRINDGSELFGDSSASSGFAALAAYDDNGDGAIDARDSVWPQLRLWRDVDHDAFSAQDELTSMTQAGIHSFSLDAAPSDYVDPHGNEFRLTASLVADAPVSQHAVDVWLVQAPIPVELPMVITNDYTMWTCWAWAYARDSWTGEVCDNQYIHGDPIVTDGDGRLSRLVARYSTSADKGTALYRSASTVALAIQVGPPLAGYCHTGLYPTPDLYYSPPYDVVGGAGGMIRRKCFSQIVHNGGGC